MSLLREAERCLVNQKAFASLNAFVTPLDRVGSWIERVKDADARRKRGAPKSSLDGKLIAIKDNICTRDVRTTCASAILENFTSPFNATVVELLEESGAIVAGKTNLDEFGMGSHSTYSHFGPVKGLRADDLGHVSAGGSSGGSAIAVATEQCYAALGTDTGGSVRLPAAYTGTVGFKPSYGLLSRWGVVAYANSLDTVGIIGANTSTVSQVFGVLNRYDHRDPTSISKATRSRIDEIIGSTSKTRSERLRIGVPIEYNILELDPFVRETWPSEKSRSHRSKRFSSRNKTSIVRYGTRDLDSPDNTGGYLYARNRGSGFGPEVKRRIVLGAFSLSAEAIDNYFIQAQKVRRLVQSDFNKVFRLHNPLLQANLTSHPKALESDGDTAEKVDVLVCPTAPSPPPLLSSLENAAPTEAYTNDVFTVPASLAGLPALSVPVTPGDREQESPIGIQVIGQFGDDQLVLDVGNTLEKMNIE
ncbi:glutamyl-tRNA(Gln) amidotransferase subunit A [Coccidioides immitis H538.4]|uniref:Glutamyl-tRNA(Gln) amidotransferase subunit A, mitochondrial n=1 Tax=Coccidioides immitis H538.4 TaxID=396776 RepID=A0A0J8RZ55_COCIT|nr:glutamyl-tRNA(Gln) amidotransferase subunit A [Coccidioides immitis H538.4]